MHFVGIGGAGMSGIAKIYLEKGYIVSGSDLTKTYLTEALVNMNAHISYYHHSDLIGRGTECVVMSSAIPPDNPEVETALTLGIPVKKRGYALAELMSEKKGIAVAGAHGKTTTTSMIALILDHCGLDPAFLIGAKLEQLGTNGRWGAGAYMVAEADESDGSFLLLKPWITVVTNVEDDHLDFYGNQDNIQKAFRRFILNTAPGGKAILCADCPVLRTMIPVLKPSMDLFTYGFDHPAMLTARDLNLHPGGSDASVWLKGRFLGRLKLKIPGKHNVSNALAALAAGLSCGLDFEDMAGILADFTGAKRRFELVGEREGILIYDDYAHHPTELKATIQAAKTLSARRLVVVFQPHRYSRTQTFAKDFANALKEVEFLVMTSVYSAGEQPISGVNTEMILKHMKPKKHQEVLFEPNMEMIPELLAPRLKSGDLVITLGAGNVSSVGQRLFEIL
jgi:UDP-N-acetylmuramate--alanine ligase